MNRKITKIARAIIIVCLITSVFVTPATAFLWDGDWDSGSDSSEEDTNNNLSCQIDISEHSSGKLGFYPDIEEVSTTHNWVRMKIEPSNTVGATDSSLCEDGGTAAAKYQVFMNGNPIISPQIEGGFEYIDDEVIRRINVPQGIEEDDKFQAITKRRSSTEGYELTNQSGMEKVEDWKFQDGGGSGNWVFPDITDDSGEKVVSSIDYTDLWYEMTILEEDTDQYNVLRNQLNVTIGETAGATFLLGARDTIDRGAITNTPKTHTYTWNEQVDERVIENDVRTHLPSQLKTRDNPVIGVTGIEFVTIDPHTSYASPDGSSELFDTSTTTEYINTEPEVTIAATEGRITPRDTVIEEDGTEGKPADYKIEYSISSKNIEKNITVRTPDNASIPPKVYQDAFDRNDVSTQDIAIPNASAGNTILFISEYKINATEKIEEYKRSATAQTNDEGEFTGYEYGPWQKMDTSYKNYSTSRRISTSRTLYNPTVNVEYNSFEKQNKVFVYMNMKTTQPIAGFTPQYYGSTTTDERPAQAITTTNMYFSRSVPRFRGTLSQDDILPVTHGATPSRMNPQIDTQYADNMEITSASGEVGTYSDPSGIDMPIQASAVRKIDELSVYAEYSSVNFNDNRIMAQGIIPETDVNINATKSDIGSSNVSVVNTKIKTDKTPNGSTHVELITVHENETFIPTAKYAHTNVRMTIGDNTRTINTDQDGNLTYTADFDTVVDATPPEMITAKVVTDTEAARNASQPVFLGSLSSTGIQYTAIGSFESNVMTIFTTGIQQFLWYFFPAIMLLGVVTKAITGEWIPYIND